MECRHTSASIVLPTKTGVIMDDFGVCFGFVKDMKKDATIMKNEKGSTRKELSTTTSIVFYWSFFN
jgi:hypothetical protein